MNFTYLSVAQETSKRYQWHGKYSDKIREAHIFWQHFSIMIHFNPILSPQSSLPLRAEDIQPYLRALFRMNPKLPVLHTETAGFTLQKCLFCSLKQALLQRVEIQDVAQTFNVD